MCWRTRKPCTLTSSRTKILDTILHPSLLAIVRKSTVLFTNIFFPLKINRFRPTQRRKKVCLMVDSVYGAIRTPKQFSGRKHDEQGRTLPHIQTTRRSEAAAGLCNRKPPEADRVALFQRYLRTYIY